MEYYDKEYLDLFKKIKEQSIQEQITTKDYSFDQLRSNSTDFNNYKLNETPQYANYEAFENLNEVQRSNYSQDYNINEFNIETRVNGQNLQNLNEVKRQQKEDRLNEVMEHIRQQRLDEVKQTEKLNEVVNFKDAQVVTVEMFNKALYNSMLNIYNERKSDK
jgi:hypothetical protein